MNGMGLKSRVIGIIKRILLLPQNESLNMTTLIKVWNVKIGKYFYKKKYDTNDIIEVLKKWGIGPGSNIFIHSSWSNFYNYNGNEENFINGILDLITPEGTLVMPCIPLLRKNRLFNVKKTVTKAGLLAESFRHYPNVYRSANVTHSVVAIGPLAEYLIKDHANDGIRFDKNSPFYKMCITNDFKVISFGLTSYFIGTIIHTLEANNYRKYSRFNGLYDFDHMIKNEYIDEHGLLKAYYSPSENYYIRPSYFKIRHCVRKYFDKSKYKKTRLSNLCISMYDCGYTYNKMIDLADRGIFFYV